MGSPHLHDEDRTFRCFSILRAVTILSKIHAVALMLLTPKANALENGTRKYAMQQRQ